MGCLHRITSLHVEIAIVYVGRRIHTNIDAPSALPRWEQCLDDYRLGVIDTFRMYAGARSYAEWTYRNIEPFMAEYRRLRCDELLG